MPHAGTTDRTGDEGGDVTDKLAVLLRRARLLLALGTVLSAMLIYVAVQIVMPALRVARLEAQVAALPVTERASIDSLGAIETRDRDSIALRLSGLEGNVAALLALSCATLSPRDLVLARAPCQRAALRSGLPLGLRGGGGR